MISGTIVVKNQSIDSQISNGWFLIRIGFKTPVNQPMVNGFDIWNTRISPALLFQKKDMMVATRKQALKTMIDCTWKVDVSEFLKIPISIHISHGFPMGFHGFPIDVH